MTNIVLTGFMGTGKSAVGRQVARRLGRPFVDMDALLEARAGKPISRIFAEEGEQAFRLTEADLCGELAGQDGAVIATGGGALVDPANRETLAASSILVCLQAGVDEILERVGEAGDRPLLSVPDPSREVRQLLAARRDAYAAIPWQVDTNGRTPSQIADEIVALASCRTLPVATPGGRYDIHIGT
ncbi:MAG: shikimate kinase, partial [Anaerolineae bacterium]|nr:shikimate kinase [Anaerolineae bacterium]